MSLVATLFRMRETGVGHYGSRSSVRVCPDRRQHSVIVKVAVRLKCWLKSLQMTIVVCRWTSISQHTMICTIYFMVRE